MDSRAIQRRHPNAVTRRGGVRIGISGWRGHFYPPKLRQRHEFEMAAEHTVQQRQQRK